MSGTMPFFSFVSCFNFSCEDRRVGLVQVRASVERTLPVLSLETALVGAHFPLWERVEQMPQIVIVISCLHSCHLIAKFSPSWLLSSRYRSSTPLCTSKDMADGYWCLPDARYENMVSGFFRFSGLYQVQWWIRFCVGCISQCRGL